MTFISKTVEDMIHDGKLYQAVVVDSEGLPVDARGEMFDPEILSAFAFPLQEVLRNLQDTLGIEKIKELSLRTIGRKLRITMSFFSVNATDFCLIILSPGTSAPPPALSELVPMEEGPPPAETPEQPDRPAAAVETPAVLEGPLPPESLEALSEQVSRKLFRDILEQMVERRIQRATEEAVQREMDKLRSKAKIDISQE
ncbi:MAG: roadblock/LC7 domain-containing protein [Acidobacteriota bacterium]|nr:roadblock/LC7 domain-containing protein [Acidobacteriota bacterium]